MIQINKEGNKITSICGSAKARDIRKYGMIQASLKDGIKTKRFQNKWVEEYEE